MTYSVGFIGGGGISHNHADRVRELNNNVSAVADISDEVREEFAANYRIPEEEQYHDYETMISEANLDIVVVGVPNSLHADCAIAALKEDVHVFVEKPLAHTIDAAHRIYNAAQDSDAVVMTGFMKPFSLESEFVRGEIENGNFGEVYDVSVEYVRQRGIPQLGSWFTQKEVAGGGVLIDLGVHVIHLALHLLDFPRVTEVSANTESKFGVKDDYTYDTMYGGEPTEDCQFDVEDSARALIRTADGTTINLDCAWASNRPPTRDITVLGTQSGAKFTSGEYVDIFSTDGEEITEYSPEIDDVDMYRREWEYFFDVLEGNRKHTRNTLEEALAVQRVIDAIYDSSRVGESVDVTPVVSQSERQIEDKQPET